MREIKFRAWYTDDDGASSMFYFTLADGMGFTHGYLSKFPVMQYTGLKDKNGVEIYEGEILTIDDDGEFFPQEYNEDTDEWEPIGTYEIFWSEDSACFWVRGVGKSETPELEYSPWNYASYEVIGNIYENKDLLEIES